MAKCLNSLTINGRASFIFVDSELLLKKHVIIIKIELTFDDFKNLINSSFILSHSDFYFLNIVKL